MITDLQSKLESLLLVFSGPIAFKKLAGLLKVDAAEIREALEHLDELYQNENRGLQIVFAGNEAQLVTNPKHSAIVEAVLKAELKEELTPAALETLAVVVYRGPVRKADIDFIRGVNSAYTLRSLMVRGLVDRQQDSTDARSFAYSVTPEFMTYLGLGKISDLPEYQETLKKLEDVKREFEHNQGEMPALSKIEMPASSEIERRQSAQKNNDQKTIN